ncbi:hypothetical protein F3Y22_tig00111013pilonHSYRG00302 [Hibiscus syriacus]|uniref:Uncharacterized protein n=1 Tax=Hibiscus syriacus TaxID=106335 RepID=A0A6A2Z6M7_HIBSY|nr:hypothetical protein F3Y22_tig00111013pilonHSYRG00302 [Hibiscus syriacus]
MNESSRYTDASTSELLNENHGSNADQSQRNAYNGGIGEGSTSNRQDTSGQVNSPPFPSDDRSSSITSSGTVQHSETRTQKHYFFTTKQVSSAIDASEKARILCSVIVAILVVLVRAGFPLLGNRFVGNIISIRPLYFILLTNVTLVMGRLLYGDHVSSRRAIAEENKPSSTEDDNWAEQLSKTLGGRIGSKEGD